MVALPLLAPTPIPVAPPRSVRLSLTDRCDLACIYCRPDRSDGYKSPSDRLDLQAWKVMLEGLVRAGVRRVRLTGGEPLLSPFVVDVIRHLRDLALDDVAMTTNATRLAALASPLREAGLHRINVSLDTLDEARFARMTRGGDLGVVLEGIDAALSAGFDEVKLNTVVVRGENDHELAAIVGWAWERGITPRFLEVMAIGEGHKLMDRLVTAAEMREGLFRDIPQLAGSPGERDSDRGPARYISSSVNPRLRVGFITGTSDTYCAGCDRLRVSSDGILRPCLATNDGIPAAGPARSGDAATIAGRVGVAWSLKPDGETWRGCTESTAAKVSIRAIGG